MSTRAIRIVVAALAAAGFLAGCSSTSLSDGDKKLCREAAEGDLTAIAADKSLADNDDIRKNAQRITPPPDAVGRINNDALDAILRACTKAGWKNTVAQEAAAQEAAARASAKAEQDARDNQPPQPAATVTLPAPTCKEEPFNGLRHLAHYTGSLMGIDDPGKVAVSTYMAEMDGSGEFNDTFSGDHVTGSSMSYLIPDCTSGRAVLDAATMNQYIFEVSAQPATLKGCRERQGPVVTDFAVSHMVGRKYCLPIQSGALYLAFEAAGAPNANGAPDLTVTYALYTASK